MSKTLKPFYPKRMATLIGLAVPKEVLEQIKRDSDHAFNAMFPIRYVCTCETSSGMLFSASIVTHCDLEVYCDWKGYKLFTLDASPELALPGERTEIGL
jgi:hypothetical protein